MGARQSTNVQVFVDALTSAASATPSRGRDSCIYDSAAPLPDAVMTSPPATFLAEIRRIVTSAIEANGGTMQLMDAATQRA